MGQTIFAMYIFKCAICIVGLPSISKKGLTGKYKVAVPNQALFDLLKVPLVKK
jgi:hypothetical protein